MTKVLMIGLDAAEPSLVEQWMATGHLPHLARLRAQASYGRMSLGKDWIAATPWPSFYTGRSVSDHGLYQFLQWRPQSMQSVRPHNDWLPLEPFWRQLSEAGPRVIAADVPLTYPSRPFNGIEVSAWASHDWLGPANTFPTGLLAEITRRLGKVPRQPEIHRMLAAEDMLAQRDELLEITGKVADLGEMLITENAWDFFLICFGATHRAGHKLWDRTSITPTPEHEQSTELAHALRDVYVACDEAIGRLSSKVDADTTVIVFSLHGMGPNNSRLNLLPEMLDRVLAGRAPNTSKGRQPERTALVQQLRKLMPEEWRERVKRRLPLQIQDRLTAFWRFGNRDWQGTRAFPLVGDLHGYVRVNLAGRESQGVVAPGQEYDDLCEALIAGLTTFVDADSGEPVVEEVIRTDRYFPDGRRRDFLPDLVVRWTETPSARHRLIQSAHFGEIAWPAPGNNPDGRSGNHRHQGMVFIRHPGLQAGGGLDHACIHDLVPTVYRLLDVPVPAALPGKSLV